MILKRSTFLLLFIFFMETNDLEAQIEGQVSLWGMGQEGGTKNWLAGAHFLPQVSKGWQPGDKLFLDIEASFLITTNFRISPLARSGPDDVLQFYRLWLRVSGEQSELRLGRQKINFGPALLLRPLMWFERIDARDPLQLTTGVDALLFRYYYQNNANFWIWTLLSNGKTKGWESEATVKNAPEYGGRLQYPLGKGEIATTFHYRRIAKDRFTGNAADEYRLAFDGKWDYVAGIWFSLSSFYRTPSSRIFRYFTLFTAGADYTFSIGNGLHVIAEHLWMNAGPVLFSGLTARELSGLSLDYPLSLVDTIRMVVFIDHYSGTWFRFLTWQQLYDMWSVNLNFFWNAKNGRILPQQEIGPVQAFSGAGIQLQLVYDF